MGSGDQFGEEINRKIGNAVKRGAQRAGKAIYKAIQPFLLALLPYLLIVLFVVFLMLIVGSLFTYGGTEASMMDDNSIESTVTVNFIGENLTPEVLNLIGQYNDFARYGNVIGKWIVNPDNPEQATVESQIVTATNSFSSFIGNTDDATGSLEYDAKKRDPYYKPNTLPNCADKVGAACISDTGTAAYGALANTCSGSVCICAGTDGEDSDHKQTATTTSCCARSVTGAKCRSENGMQYCCCVKDFYGREGQFLLDWKDLYAGVMVWHSATTVETSTLEGIGNDEIDVSTATKVKITEDLHPYFFYKAANFYTITHSSQTTETASGPVTTSYVTQTASRVYLLTEAYTIKGWYQFNHKWVRECSDVTSTTTQTSTTSGDETQIGNTTYESWSCTYKEVPDGDPILVDSDVLSRLKQWIKSYYNLTNNDDLQDYLSWFMYISKDYQLIPALTDTYNASFLSEMISAGAGQLVWPVPGYYNITSPFGWRISPITGRYEHHNGVDIAAPEGSPIIVAADCKVVSAGMESQAGLAIRCEDSNYQYLYAHTSAIFVNPGDVVHRGDTIALVGHTGDATGPHLHFAMLDLKTWQWVQPLDFISP